MDHTVKINNSHPLPIRAIAALSTLCGVIASLMIFASVLITCQMIFVRFVMGRSTIWQTEAVIYLMIAATLIGLPYVQKLRGHVGVDLLPTLLPPRARRILAVFVLATTACMIAIMLWFAWDMFHLAWARNWKSETVWAVRLWIPYMSVPLGFGLFLLQLVADLWLVVCGEDTGAPVPLEDRRH
ncbi:MAG: TRAP transporter small permease [Rhodobacter sp.]|nr:TRAP transporter small permease [Rhodobacter sp.]